MHAHTLCKPGLDLEHNILSLDKQEQTMYTPSLNGLKNPDNHHDVDLL